MLKRIMFSATKRIFLSNTFAKIRFSTYPQINDNTSNSWDSRRIAPNLYLDYHLDNNNNNNGGEGRSKGRPLVLLMSWLRAKEKYLQQYNDMYMRKGFDVLTAQLGGYDMFYPDYTGKLCLNTLENELSHYDSILVHAFSFGVYVYGTMLLENQKRENDQKGSQSVIPFEDRIKGVVLDSVVTADLILGLSESLKDLPNSYKLYMRSHQMFLKLHKNTTNYLLGLNDILLNSSLRTPALVMASDGDPFDNVVLSEKFVSNWRKRDIDVKYRRWKSGPHVQLMKYNRDEYCKLVEELIDKIQVIDKVEREETSNFDKEEIDKMSIRN